MPTSTATPTSPGVDPVLTAEQAHLEHARDQLRRMREATDRLDAAKATDAWTSELLGRVLARRVASLQDDPRTTLFFGRIDTRTEHGEETFHIGRRHVSDDGGDPVVVDWRAPISTAFYRASPTEPMGVDAAPAVRRGPRTAHRPTRTSTSPAATAPTAAPSSPRRSSAPDPARCATSSRPSSRSRTRSCAATSARASASRVRPARARRRSACTVRPGCSTPSAPSSTAPACSSSAPTAPSSTTSAPCCPPSARCASGTPPSTPCSTHGRVRADGPHRRRRSSRATPGWPRCCTGRSGRTSAAPTEALVVPARLAPLAGARPRGPRRRRRARRPRGALLRRPAAAAPAAGPPGAAADGALRRLPRRPGAGHRRPLGAGHRVRPRAVAGARPGRRPLPPPQRRRGAGRRRGRHPHRRRATAALVGQPAAHEGCRPLDAGRHGAPRRGRRPARAHPAAWGTWCSTRPRTSRPCSCAPSVVAPRPGRSPCSATSPRARRRGPPRPGTPRWATSGARGTSSSCSTAASACRAWSSSSPHACCRTWRPAWGRRPRCATTPVGSRSCPPARTDGTPPSWMRCARRSASPARSASSSRMPPPPRPARP